MWQLLQAASLDLTEVQKLLTTCFLPRTCWVSGLVHSHFQCWVLWICLAASVWQARQALVTSGPELNFWSSSLNLEWSAVVVCLRGLGASAQAVDTAASASQLARQTICATRCRLCAM